MIRVKVKVDDRVQEESFPEDECTADRLKEIFVGAVDELMEGKEVNRILIGNGDDWALFLKEEDDENL